MEKVQKLHSVLSSVRELLSSKRCTRVVHEEQSPYQNIKITESDEIRYMVLPTAEHRYNQSSQLLSDPQHLSFTYTKMILAGLLVMPDPQRILITGLGGGTIPRVLRSIFPTAWINVVEVDAAVHRLAQAYFGFNEDDHLKVTIADARDFIREVGALGRQYDLIILDAFNGDYIPQHLMTYEFLSECRTALSTNGVLISNTFTTSTLYDQETATYVSAFGRFFNLSLPGVSFNRVIIAAQGELPDEETLHLNALRTAALVERFGVDMLAYPTHMELTEDGGVEADVLHDPRSVL